MAIIWFTTLQTLSGKWVAAFMVCACLPQFLLSFVGGVLADCYNRKLLIIGADALIAAVTLAMWFAMLHIGQDSTLLLLLLILSALRSCGAGIQTSAVQAVLPALVPKEELMRYNAINATMQSIVNFAAPATAGAVLSLSALYCL